MYLRSSATTIRRFYNNCGIYRNIITNNDEIIFKTIQIRYLYGGLCGRCIINTRRCKRMSITRSSTRTQSQYSLFSQYLAHASSYKYLGIYFTDILSRNEHIEDITSRSLKMLGFIRRTLYLATPETKLLAYTTIDFPNLDYACTFWNPRQNYILKRVAFV